MQTSLAAQPWQLAPQQDARAECELVAGTVTTVMSSHFTCLTKV